MARYRQHPEVTDTSLCSQSGNVVYVTLQRAVEDVDGTGANITLE